jgi:indole-3-glycerol phosphate synthase
MPHLAGKRPGGGEKHFHGGIMAVTILDQLADYARLRVEKAKEKISAEEMKEKALSLAAADREESFRFEKALSGPELSFICECKKASPSKGLIAPDFPYAEIAVEYEKAGADCISVLTEPKWFLGENRFLDEIARNVRIPCLRKDFTVDPYMIYEAKTLGASAVLLICSILELPELEAYIRIADSLGLSALVEAHDAAEIRDAIKAGARIIGVNNRNLKDFTVDARNSLTLREEVPEGILFVAESGIKSAEDVEALRRAGVDACLVGETLMRASDKKAKLLELKGGPRA